MQSSHFFFWPAFLLSLGVFGLFIVADLSGSVLILGDRLWFQPIIYNYAENSQLAHPFMSPVTSSEGVGGPLVWHGWMMPQAMGALTKALLPEGSITQSSFSTHVLALIVFTGFAFLFKARVRASALYLPIFLTLFLYQAGRPDLMASLILLAFLWLQKYRRHTWHVVSTALLLAAAAASSPNAAIMLAFYCTLKELTSGRPRHAQWRYLLVLLVLAPAFLATLTAIFTDMDIREWLAGLATHSQWLLGRTDGSILGYYVYNPLLPFMFIFVAITALWLITLLRQPRMSGAWPVALIFVGFFYVSALHAPAMVYNLAWLMPLVFYDLANLSRTPMALVIAIALAFSFSAILLTFGKVANLHNGVPALRLVNAVENLPDDPLMAELLPAIAVLQPEIGLSRFTRNPEQAQIRIALQVLTGRRTPLVHSGECLLVSAFHEERATAQAELMRVLRQDWAFALIALKPCPQP